MCQDHDLTTADAAPALAPAVHDAEHGLSRRRFLLGAGTVAGAGLVLGTPGWLPRARASSVASLDGLPRWTMAMHVHSSFSEGPASMESQLVQASKNALDVMWWTDHEWKMRARNFKTGVHFTSLTDEHTDGTPWKWIEQRSGSLASVSGGGIVSTGSPNDTVSSGSLRVCAQASSAGSLATFGYTGDGGSPKTQRVNAFGQVWSVDVLPQTLAGSDAYLEMRITLSLHPAQAGRPYGKYAVAYRWGGPDKPGTRRSEGILGIVSMPTKVGSWNSGSVTMSDDVAALWPDMDPRDFCVYSVSFYAGSTGSRAEGLFDNVRIQRPYTTGDVPLQVQQEIMQHYAPRFPSVTQHQGVEVSWTEPHVNWFGGAVTIPTYISGTGTTWSQFVASTIGQIHAAGGIASYNHPFGAGNRSSAYDKATQDAQQRVVASQLLGNRLLGADLVEIGYPQRNGYDLDHHLALWDTLSRNGFFLTGNGSNDDHGGVGWSTLLNNWTTGVWAASTAESDLLAALLAGRAWAGPISSPVTLDLMADGSCPMGSVSVSTARSRSVQVQATGLPAGSTLELVRGAVDYAGTADPTATSTRVASVGAAGLTAGSTTLSVDTSASCFVRAVVRSSSGGVLCASNPLWMLRETPPTPIPAARAA